MDMTYQQIHICGGLSGTHPANEQIQHICDKVKPEAEQKAGTKFGNFTAVSYKSQVVSGSNFFIKVNVGGHNCVHICVYEKLACNGGGLKLTAIQQSKSQQDPIEYF